MEGALGERVSRRSVPHLSLRHSFQEARSIHPRFRHPRSFVLNVRPKCSVISTKKTTVFGLMPIFWTNGRGSDVMPPMAIQSVGGLAVSLCVRIFIAPCLFCAMDVWKWHNVSRLDHG